jgi:hypothetical protein
MKDAIERQCIPHPNVTTAHIWWTLTTNGADTGSSLGRIDCIRFWAIRDIQDVPLLCHGAGKFYSTENLHLTDTVLWDTLKGHSIFREHYWCNFRRMRIINIDRHLEPSHLNCLRIYRVLSCIRRHFTNESMQIALLYMIRPAHSGVSECSSLLECDAGTWHFEIWSCLNPEGEWDLNCPITFEVA